MISMRHLLILTLLLLSSCNGDVLAPSSAPPPAPGGGAKKLTVIVAVVDSLMPQDLTSATPNLNGLKTGGTFYAESRSVFSAETIPNHVAMMTGVYPRRNGIAANNFIDSGVNPPVERNLSLPEELTANTLFTWIRRKCVSSGINPEIKTGATLSKKYLFEVFAGDAADPARANRNPSVDNVQPDSYWDPRSSPAYIGSPDEHTPDLPTMQQALAQLPGVDFLFISLGDVDRAAHAFVQAGRNAALPVTDAQVGRLISALQSAGRWENTVLFLVSDHGMDFTSPPSFINVQPALTSLGACFKPMTAVDVGGTNSIFVTDPTATPAEKQAAARAARACLMGTTACATLCAGASRPVNADKIGFAWYTQDDPADPDGTMPESIASKHPNLGNLVLTAMPGFRFSEPSSSSNPILGTHGHLVTLRNTFIVAGGSPWVKKGQVIASSVSGPSPFDRLPEQSENVDLAPTIAWLLGLNIQSSDFPDGRGSFDGRLLKEAFTQFDANPDAGSPTQCGRFD